MLIKYRILFCFLLLNLIAKLVLAQCTDTRYNIQTPRGSDVPDTYQTCEMSASDRAGWDNYFATHYPNAVQIKLPGEQYSSTRTFNCHGYAWRYTENSQRVWIGYSQTGSEEVFWNDGSYDELTEAVCTKISYTGDHSAAPSGTANYYYSKWNMYPLMYHHKDYTPGYGSANQFFRRSVDVPQDQSTIASAVALAVSGQTVNVSNAQTLSANVTVPSGVTLLIKSSATINPNGYSIITTSGTITIESGATVNGPLLMTGSTIKGIYPTMQSALGAAVSGQAVVVSNSQTLTSNVTVQSGVTLAFQTGSSVNFGSYYIIVNGSAVGVDNINCAYLMQSITLKGLFPSIQSAINYSSSNQTVQLQSRTYNGSVSVTSKTNVNINGNGISSSTINGSVSFNSSQGCYLQNLQINGISLNSSQGCYLQNLQVNNNVSINYGSGFNYLSNLNVQGWIAPNMGSSTFISYATMTTSNYYGILGGYCTCHPDHSQIKHKSTGGVSASAMNMNCDLVTFCNNTWDVTNNGGSNNIYLGNCLFSSSVEGSTINSSGVTWNWWLYCGASKDVANQDEVLSKEIKDLPSDLDGLSEGKRLAGKRDYAKVIKDYWALFDKIKKEKKDSVIDFKQYEKELGKIIAEFEDIINKYPGSVSSVQSLQEIIECYRLLQDQPSAKQIVYNLLLDKNYEEVSPHIKFLSIPLLIDEQDYDGALNLCDTVISEIPSNLEAACLLFNKGKIYETLKNDTSEANRIYTQLEQQYPNSMYAELASQSCEKATNPQKQMLTQKIRSFDITSYPNPFNPITVVKYQVPVASRVSLKVYDILGREVATLVDEMKEVGYYSVTFDARNFASGIYLARIVAYPLDNSKPIMLTKRMVLMK